MQGTLLSLVNAIAVLVVHLLNGSNWYSVDSGCNSKTTNPRTLAMRSITKSNALTSQKFRRPPGEEPRRPLETQTILELHPRFAGHRET